MKELTKHLCGSPYEAENACENLLYVQKSGMEHGNKSLRLYTLYCTAGNKCRSLGCIATFTGCSPTWCPKRKQLKAVEDNIDNSTSETQS